MAHNLTIQATTAFWITFLIHIIIFPIYSHRVWYRGTAGSIFMVKLRFVQLPTWFVLPTWFSLCSPLLPKNMLIIGWLWMIKNIKVKRCPVNNLHPVSQCVLALHQVFLVCKVFTQFLSVFLLLLILLTASWTHLTGYILALFVIFFCTSNNK